MSPLIDAARHLVTGTSAYAARILSDPADLRAVQTLRFNVFNLELEEGLPESHATGLDADRFDRVCDHLVVEHILTGEVVGTYRMQTGRRAATNLGYYSEQEFEFGPYERIRGQMVELGRACVDQRHRNLQVLGLLWRGIADYARVHGARYLCGCTSITSQNPSAGASAYSELCRHHLAPVELRTRPTPRYECPLDQLAEDSPKIPKLLRAYLALGARICGPPAIDRVFKTIDFLTLLDLESLSAQARIRFLT